MKYHGFTLLEILIAMLIFSIISLLTIRAISSIEIIRSHVNQQQQQLRQVQLAISILNKNILQMQKIVKFTNHFIELIQNKSHMAFFCYQQKLIQRLWLSITNKKKFIDQVLLNNLTECKFSFINKKLKVVNIWQSQQIVPKAIKFNFNLMNFGKANFIFEISEFMMQSS